MTEIRRGQVNDATYALAPGAYRLYADTQDATIGCWDLPTPSEWSGGLLLRGSVFSSENHLLASACPTYADRRSRDGG